MSSKKIAKTNAARLLERLEIPFTLHQADVDESDLSAVTMAHKLGVDPGCVFKTLVARGDKTGVIMACIPAGCSPLAAKKDYPVFLDEHAILWEQIYISAGQRGVQLCLSPDDLCRATGATMAEIANNAD